TKVFDTASKVSWDGIVQSSNPAGFIAGTLTSGNHLGLSAALEALETQGLLKLLAEPNLVAMSGEKAEFLAGGQYPYTVAQAGGGSAVNTVQFQPYGISVQFLPYVISQDKIRLVVQPEVSELDFSSIPTGTTQPAITTRKAKTTVELAPGESFMIAGLMTDRLNSSISQIPGASEIPILGALLRSTAYKRGETELVIAITPYIVDPLKSSDIKMPGDDMRPASDMEMFFYGALGTLSGNTYRTSQTPSLEGPIGFVID
ncbi:MAG: type II and III secretion system protein family protein, partial [Pseudomonadota bacterium]